MIDCSKCPEPGACCGPFQMEKGFIEKHKDKIQKEPAKIVEGSWWECALCDDLGCVFLNRKTKKCEIYEDRPVVCRLFGLSKDKRLQCAFFKPSGNPRSEASKKQVLKHIKKLGEEIEGKRMEVTRLK